MGIASSKRNASAPQKRGSSASLLGERRQRVVVPFSKSLGNEKDELSLLTQSTPCFPAHLHSARSFKKILPPAGSGSGEASACASPGSGEHASRKWIDTCPLQLSSYLLSGFLFALLELISLRNPWVMEFQDIPHRGYLHRRLIAQSHGAIWLSGHPSIETHQYRGCVY